MLKSKIELKNGSPRLYIDGKPTTAMAYTTYFAERSSAVDFLRAGYRIFFVNASFTLAPINSAMTGFTPFTVGVFENPDEPDYSEFEGEVKRILSACPDAIIFPRLYVSMPKWWVDANPTEVVKTKKGGLREALCSEKFRSDGCELISRFIKRVRESDYEKSIGGWQICGGQTQEWFHHDYETGGICEAARLPYREWVKEVYGEDNAILPSIEDFAYSGKAYNESENARRYSLFSNVCVARTVECFARHIKEETAHEQVVGTFYGYSFENNGMVTFGSHALRCLLDSDMLDFFSSPNAYTESRRFGIDWADMMPVDSIKHHGKMCFMECDIRTYLTCAIQDARPGRYPDDMYRTKDQKSLFVGPPTRELSLLALRKSFAHQIAKDSAIWWFDMWGGWYHDEALMSELRAMKDIYDRDVDKKGEFPKADVVFFADEEGYANLLATSPQLAAISDTRTKMGNTGVPYDTFAVCDAEAILKNYKAAVFPMAIPSETGRRAIELCEALGIPYLTASEDDYLFTVERLRDFYKSAGVHLYNETGDVVYLGNGYIALHSDKAGEKELKLPRPYAVAPIFGANLTPQKTDTVRFPLGENETALFNISEE